MLSRQFKTSAVLVAFEVSVFQRQWLSLVLTFVLVAVAVAIELVLARPKRLAKAA